MTEFSRSRLGHFCLCTSIAGAPLLAGAAHAQTPAVDDFGAIRTHEQGTQIESPQHTAFEIRIGRYVPGVDDEFATATPYKDMFGTDNRYSFGFEVDWQALRIPYLGTLGPGIGLAYTKITAPALIAADRTRSGEDTSLTIFPMYAVAVLRADVIARETPIPLVPYAKLGVGSAIWKISNGGGTSNVAGTAGSGLSYGPQFALGGMLLLDAFDRQHAMSLDNDVGINNSYFFVEWYESKLNGFGSGKQMQVGTNTWVLGLAFEI